MLAVGLSLGPSRSILVASPSDSSVWAGYRTSMGGITHVAATWTQPRVRPRGSGPNAVVFWVGLEGQASDTVEQIGTDADCGSGATPQYGAWYEIYPQPAVAADLSIAAGDTVTATVVSLGKNRFRLVLRNDTTGARFATTQVARDAGATAGAIFVESPSETGTSLAEFNRVCFTRCAFNGQPIGAFALTPFDIVTGGAVAETTTSELGTDGASFSVTHR